MGGDDQATLSGLPSRDPRVPWLAKGRCARSCLCTIAYRSHPGPCSRRDDRKTLKISRKSAYRVSGANHDAEYPTPMIISPGTSGQPQNCHALSPNTLSRCRHRIWSERPYAGPHRPSRHAPSVPRGCLWPRTALQIKARWFEDPNGGALTQNSWREGANAVAKRLNGSAGAASIMIAESPASLPQACDREFANQCSDWPAKRCRKASSSPISSRQPCSLDADMGSRVPPSNIAASRCTWNLFHFGTDGPSGPKIGGNCLRVKSVTEAQRRHKSIVFG